MDADALRCSCRRFCRQNLSTAAEDSGSYNPLRIGAICWRGMRRHAPQIQGREGAHPSRLWIPRALVIALAIVDLTSCATTSPHQFAEPAGDWQMRNGQLLYRNAKTTLIGEVLIRYSKNGDFELTFSKGAGVTLLALRQDSSFAEIKGPVVRGGWSGQVEQAPQRLRGWLNLRDKLIRAQDRHAVRYATGTETFLFRF